MRSTLRAAIANSPTLEITTTGRTSGKPSRIEIWMFEVEQRFIITGTPGPRDWYANLLAEPAMTVHLPGLDLEARATPLNEDALRRVVFSAPTTAWYRSLVPIDDLVACSPMVEVELLQDEES